MFPRQALSKTCNSRGRQTHQTVLLPVVQPMACPSSADDSLELVGFDPNDLIDTFVSEKCNEMRDGFITKKDGSCCTETYPQRLRHSLPSSIALQDGKMET